MNLNVFFAVLAALLVAAVLAGAVFLILALVRIRRAVVEIESLVRKVNAEMDKVERVSTAVSAFADTMGGSAGRILTGAARMAFDLIRWYRRRKSDNQRKGDDPS